MLVQELGNVTLDMDVDCYLAYSQLKVHLGPAPESVCEKRFSDLRYESTSLRSSNNLLEQRKTASIKDDCCLLAVAVRSSYITDVFVPVTF
jgi:hypothetical protein